MNVPSLKWVVLGVAAAVVLISRFFSSCIFIDAHGVGLGDHRCPKCGHRLTGAGAESALECLHCRPASNPEPADPGEPWRIPAAPRFVSVSAPQPEQEHAHGERADADVDLAGPSLGT